MLGFGCRIKDCRWRVGGVGFRAFRLLGFGCRVLGLMVVKFKVSGCRVWGLLGCRRMRSPLPVAWTIIGKIDWKVKWEP